MTLLLDAVQDAGPFFGVSARIARAAGGLEEGVFLQFLLWRERERGAAVTLTAEEIEEGTALSQVRQARVRANLRALGVITETKKGIPARIYYQINPARFQEVWEEWKTGQDEKQGSRNSRNLDPEFREPLISNFEKHSFSEEPKRTNTGEDLCEALSEERRQKPKAKPQAQPDLSLPAAAPTKIDPIALLRGDHDSRRDHPVLEATVALWASVWSRNPAAAVITKDREKFWREAMKEHRPSDFAKAVIGIWWDQSPADRARYHEFKHVARDVPQFVQLYDQHGDPRDRQPFRPGCPPTKGPAPGGGRGGDRAHGGSGEVLTTTMVMERLRVQERERDEREARERAEANTPEAKEIARQAIAAMKAKLASGAKGGGR